jgi:16S rRNA (uracil1498-N3)-methyltransferase
VNTVSTLACVNEGGPDSIARLGQVPQLDRETPLPAAALHALSRWQARPGEVMTLVDPELACYRARIVSLQPDQPCCIPFERLDFPAESHLAIAVYQALPERERFELILEKATELGVAGIMPMETQQSSTLAERDAGQKKSHRWPDLIRRAARQCRRAMLPQLFPVCPFSEALRAAASAELKLMLYEGYAAWTLTAGFGSFKPNSVALMIGPEGGFSREEVAAAQSAGFLPVSLGPRILRTETAAIAAVAIVQSHLGDLG